LLEDEGSSTFKLCKTANRFELTINSAVERSWVLRLRQLEKSPRVALRSQTGQVTVPRVAYNARSKETEVFIGPLSIAFVNIDIN
jgi:hypothetical protein